MILKNLFRRKGRTLLTLIGIAIGVAAIVALGAAAEGMRSGFAAMSQGSQGDLVLTQADAVSALLSSVDEQVADQVRTWPEVDGVDGVLLTNASVEYNYLYLFGHNPDGFAIEHFRIVEGQALADARATRGTPLLLGHRAAESLDKAVGDTLRFANTSFRIVGIYETGNSFEDSGVVIPLENAQAIMLLPRRVSMLYVQLENPAAAERVRSRLERSFPDLTVSTAAGFADQEQMFAILDAAAMVIASLAVVIGGVGMTNTLFMSTFERTREIGLLRAVGWRRRQVLQLVLGESLTLALLGGLLGIALGLATVFIISRSASWLGMLGSNLTAGLFVRALLTVTVMGLIGGAYPAWWASRLLPLEALRYEGGSSGAHLPAALPGGMTVRDLWRRRTRTALTLLGIGISIAAIVILGGVAQGVYNMMTQMIRSSRTDLIALQSGVDADYSAVHDQVGARIANRPDVEAVAGTIWTAVNTDRMSMLLVFGYHPREFAIRHFRIVDGEPLTARRQLIAGRRIADQLGLHVGDTLRLLDSNFRVVGIFETGLPYEEISVVIGLQEAQSLIGKPRQVMFFNIRLRDPRQAEAVQADLEASFPDLDFPLTADLVESMSDFRIVEELVGNISFLAVFVGGLGMLNTMLMSVLERTREIGVLRALGWHRRQILAMVLREALLLGVLGGLGGILLGVGLGALLNQVPGYLGSIQPVFGPQVLFQALLVALVAGLFGGLYPAWRATRMPPVEALRYE